MERLTEKAPKPSVNSQYVKRKGFYTADCIERLGMYEDTGLTPEEIVELKERDTAKTPIKDSDSGVRYTDDYICPNCGKHFTGTGIAAFCYHCGQRLKWEE